MHIPDQLKDWTLESIRKLVESRCGETDRFEFKSHIRGEAKGSTSRVRTTACAFANTHGGFLVFGVRDRKAEGERLLGLDGDGDHETDLSNVLSTIEPSLNFVPRNPAIRLSDGRVLMIVEVLKGTRGPHWDREALVFYRRSHGKNEPMTREEIRMAFVDHEERRRRVHMVYLSLMDNWQRLEACVAPETGSGPIPLLKPDLSVIRAHMVEFPSLCPALVDPLLRIVRELDMVCTRIDHLHTMLRAHPQVQQDVAGGHRAEIFQAMKHRLQPQMDHVLIKLQGEFGFPTVNVKIPRNITMPPLPLEWPMGRLH